MEKKKNIHSGHRQRMKQTVAENGMDALKDYQVLELILYYALPRVDTNPIAHELINEFGSLKGVFEASEGELCRINGIGKGAAELINLFRCVSLRYSYECSVGVDNPKFDNTNVVRKYFENKFCGLKCEELHVIALDNRCRLAGHTVISRGTSNRVGFSTRLLVDFAVKCGSNKLIIAHNHPSELCLPSKEDILLTSELVDTMKKLDINLFDHIIVGCDGSVSMRSSRYGISIWKEQD